MAFDGKFDTSTHNKKKKSYSNKYEKLFEHLNYLKSFVLLDVV